MTIPDDNPDLLGRALELLEKIRLDISEPPGEVPWYLDRCFTDIDNAITDLLYSIEHEDA